MTPNLQAAFRRLEPDQFWKRSRQALLVGLALGIALILLGSATSLILQVAVAGLLVGALVFGFLVQDEIALLCGILAGFVVAVRYAEGFQIEEVIYGLVYLGYLGYWFVSRLFFYRDTILRTAVDWALFLFLLLATLSLVLNPLLDGEPRQALSEWLSITMLAFYFPIKEVCIRHRDRLPQRPILYSLGGVALFIVVRNLLDYRRGLSEAEYLWQIAAGRVVMNEHFLMMAGLITLVFLLYASDWRQRSVLAGLFAIFSVGVVIGQSRAVWVSFLLGMAIIFFFVDRRRQVQIALMSLFAAGVILTAGFVFFEETFVLIFAGLVDRFLSLATAATQDISLINRFVEMGAAWESIRENPIIGYGFGVPYKYYSLIYQYTRESSYVHNGYVGILYRHGFVGFFLLFTFYGGAMWHAFKAARTLEPASIGRISAVAAIAFLAAEALVGHAANPFVNADTNLIIASTAGLAAASYHYAGRE